MKSTFTRWLPAIARTPYRKTALTVAGVAAIAGLATGPAMFTPPSAGTPNPDAVAAIDLATGRDKPPAGQDQPAGVTSDNPAATAGAASQPADRPADPDTAAQSGGSGSIGQSADKPAMDRLIPYGVQGGQSRVGLGDEQIANAKTIVDAAKKTGVGERGAVIGVATALQESKLHNLGHLGAVNDHDSEGLFQQRPSSGWGTSEQVTDPEYASTAFFGALKNVPGWHRLPLTVAAQNVQVSAYPFAYAQWEQQAADVVQQVWTK